MDNFDLKKYLAEGRLFENEDDFKNQIITKYGNSTILTYIKSFVEDGEVYVPQYEEWEMSIEDIIKNIEEDSFDYEMTYEELLEAIESLPTIPLNSSEKEKSDMVDQESSGGEEILGQNIRLFVDDASDYWSDEDERYSEDDIDIFEENYAILLEK